MRHYFDWAASAIPDESETDSLICGNPPIYGNPSSRHSEGRNAKDALESARSRCAAVLGTAPQNLYFTSGGTEANCIALFSNLLKPNGRIIASAAEHHSITENIETLKKLKKPVGEIKIDSFGRVSPQLFAQALDRYGDVRFAAVMAVNNETGTINDLCALKEVLRQNKGPPVHIHCDMVQAVGKVPLHFDACDSAAISAHKIGGPRGIGLLYLRNPQFNALYSGGGQERKIRPGTENVLGALALAACLEKHASFSVAAEQNKLAGQRMEKLISALSLIERCIIIPKQRIDNAQFFSPYILQAAFKGIPGAVMVRTLDDEGFAVSTGSACSSSSPERPVLSAMGIAKNISLWGIRISQAWSTSKEQIDLLIQAIEKVLKNL